MAQDLDYRRLAADLPGTDAAGRRQVRRRVLAALGAQAPARQLAADALREYIRGHADDRTTFLATLRPAAGRPAAPAVPHGEYNTLAVAYLDALVDARNGDPHAAEVADVLHALLHGEDVAFHQPPEDADEHERTDLSTGVIVALDTAGRWGRDRRAVPFAKPAAPSEPAAATAQPPKPQPTPQAPQDPPGAEQPEPEPEPAAPVPPPKPIPPLPLNRQQLASPRQTLGALKSHLDQHAPHLAGHVALPPAHWHNPDVGPDEPAPYQFNQHTDDPYHILQPFAQHVGQYTRSGARAAEAHLPTVSRAEADEDRRMRAAAPAGPDARPPQQPAGPNRAGAPGQAVPTATPSNATGTNIPFAQPAEAGGGFKYISPGQKSPISGRTIRSQQAWYDAANHRLVYGIQSPHTKLGAPPAGKPGEAGPDLFNPPPAAAPGPPAAPAPQRPDAFTQQIDRQAGVAPRPGAEPAPPPGPPAPHPQAPTASVNQHPDVYTRQAESAARRIAAHARDPQAPAPTEKDYHDLFGHGPSLPQPVQVDVRNQILEAAGPRAALKESMANALRKKIGDLVARGARWSQKLLGKIVGDVVEATQRPLKTGTNRPAEPAATPTPEPAPAAPEKPSEAKLAARQARQRAQQQEAPPAAPGPQPGQAAPGANPGQRQQFTLTPDHAHGLDRIPVGGSALVNGVTVERTGEDEYKVADRDVKAGAVGHLQRQDGGFGGSDRRMADYLLNEHRVEEGKAPPAAPQQGTNQQTAAPGAAPPAADNDGQWLRKVREHNAGIQTVGRDESPAGPDDPAWGSAGTPTQPRVQDDISAADKAGQAAWRGRLTDADRDMLGRYTGYLGYKVNRLLRTGQGDAEAHRAADRLGQILKDARFQEPQSVWRGVGTATMRDILAQSRGGRPFTMAGVQSTSLDPDLARIFDEDEGGARSGFLLNIDTDRGAYVDTLDGQPDLTPHHQKEVLIPHGTRYEKAGESTITLNGRQYKVLHLKTVADDARQEANQQTPAPIVAPPATPQAEPAPTVAPQQQTNQQTPAPIVAHPPTLPRPEAAAPADAALGHGRPQAPEYGPGYNVPLSDLHVDPERFQYKVQDVGKGGVTSKLKDVSKWDPKLAGIVAVWRDPADGKDYVVNGHHRYELGKRLGAKDMRVQYLQADTPTEARALGALINIGEGMGTALDAAKFIRDSGRTPEEMKREGISLKGAVAADGVTLSKLADPLFRDLTLGRVDQERAKTIASHLPDDPDAQMQLYNFVNDLEKKRGADDPLPAKVVERMAEKFAAAPKDDSGQADLFGEGADQSTFVDQVQLENKIRADLVRQVRNFEAVKSEQRAEATKGAGNVLNVGRNREEFDKAAELLHMYDKLSLYKGEVADILREEGALYARAKGKGKDAVTARALARVRDAVGRQAGPALAAQPGAAPEAGPGVPPPPPAAGGVRAGTAEGVTPPAAPAPDPTAPPGPAEVAAADEAPLPPPKPLQDHLRDQHEAVKRLIADLPESDLHGYVAALTGDGSPGTPEELRRRADAHVEQTYRPVRLAPPPPGQSVTPPPGGKAYEPDPRRVNPQTGQTAAARVGVEADHAPPPPPLIPRLPRLTEAERAAETHFADAYLAGHEAMIADYRRQQNTVVGQDARGNPVYAIGDAPNIFNTDDAKQLSPHYNPPGVGDDENKAARARFNTAVHQTANALAKRAFLSYLDDTVAKLPEGQRTVLVTSGGVAAGKGHALKSTDRGRQLQSMAAAVWDAAGEQNATENDWVLEQCTRRGIKATFAYVHADPVVSWSHPKRGVFFRAKNVGRMVDARVFADSYDIGPKNFQSFFERNRDNPNAEFIILDNSGDEPVELPAVPEAALKTNAEHLYAQASALLKQHAPSLTEAILDGGSAGHRIWGMPDHPGEPAAPEQAPAPTPPASATPASAAGVSPHQVAAAFRQAGKLSDAGFADLKAKLAATPEAQLRESIEAMGGTPRGADAQALAAEAAAMIEKRRGGAAPAPAAPAPAGPAATIGQRVKGLLERSRAAELLPEPEVKAALDQLRPLPRAALVEVAKAAGIKAWAGETAAALFKKIERNLTAGRRAREQIAQ